MTWLKKYFQWDINMTLDVYYERRDASEIVSVVCKRSHHY